MNYNKKINVYLMRYTNSLKSRICFSISYSIWDKRFVITIEDNGSVREFDIPYATAYLDNIT